MLCVSTSALVFSSSYFQFLICPSTSCPLSTASILPSSPTRIWQSVSGTHIRWGLRFSVFTSGQEQHAPSRLEEGSPNVNGHSARLPNLSHSLVDKLKFGFTSKTSYHVNGARRKGCDDQGKIREPPPCLSLSSAAASVRLDRFAMSQLILKYATLNPPLIALLAQKYVKTNQNLKIVPSKNLPDTTPAELIFPSSGYRV